MSAEFKNVSLVARGNVYFDGKCVSHTFFTADGKRKTVGVILPAKLTFGTGDPEVVDVVEGRCKITLKGEAQAREYRPGQSFSVSGNSSFDIEVLETLHYVCHFG